MQRVSLLLHRVFGLAAALFLSLLAITGLLLNHPALLGGASARVRALAVDPVDPQRMWRGTEAGLFRSEDNGRTWDEVSMLLPVEHVVGIAYVPGDASTIYVADRDWGLIRSCDGGVVWEAVDCGFVPALEGVALEHLALGPTGEIRLWTSAGWLRSDDGGSSWSHDGSEAQGSTGLRGLVHQIHTGYFFGRGMVYVYDGAAIAVVVLMITGFMLWRRRNGSRNGNRHGNRNAVARTWLVWILMVSTMVTTVSIRSEGAGIDLTRARLLMGTAVTVQVWAADSNRCDALADAAFAEIERIDQLVSTWRENSRIAVLNRCGASGWVEVEPSVYELLSSALHYAAATDGAFDPTVLPLMQLWGFRGGDPREPTLSELRVCLQSVGHEFVILHPDGKRVRFALPGVAVDLGGIAKGYALDRVVERLRAEGAAGAVIDLGGNLGAFGEGPAGWVATLTNSVSFFRSS